MNKLLFAALTAFAFSAAAQTPPLRVPMSAQVAAMRHVEALGLEKRGDEKGAFIAFLEAAEDGYSPAQLRVGEIYNNGNSAVVRDYAQAIHWYEKARDAGEKIPPLPKIPGAPTTPALPRLY
jgi:TPR repeat protein